MKASRASFLSCVRFEFARGIFSVIPCMAALAVCACAAQVAFAAGMHNAGIGGYGIADALMGAFRGMDVFHPESRLPFVMDAYWAVPRLLIGYIACFIPVRDLKGYSAQVVTRCESRAGWLVAKMALGASAVVFYYAACVVFAWLNALVFAGSDGASSLDAASLLGMDPNASASSVLCALGLSFIADLSLVPLCMALALGSSAVASYAALVVVLVASAFFASPYLWMNATMLVRSFLAFSGGLSAEAVALGCAVALAAGLACCYVIGRRVEYR